MFPMWRLQLRDARRAVADGRWDEAAELLSRDSLREFLPVKQLSQELAGRFVERARTRMADGQSHAGWRDLNLAARLGARQPQIVEFRQREAAERLARAIDELARGDAAAARHELVRMEQRNLGGAERRTWQMIAQQIDHAEQRAVKGDSAAAIESFDRARRLLPADGAAGVHTRVEQRLQQLRESAGLQHELDARLHAAVAAGAWTEALAAADALLELAPQHAAARQARSKAWQAVGLEATQVHAPTPLGRPATPLARRPAAGSTHAYRRSAKADTVTTNRERDNRLVAWIDAVGGYMLCLGDDVVLGQPSAGGDADVAILADISRRHAAIRRESEAYVLTPMQATTLDGKAIDGPTLLRDKCVIGLGKAVKVRFLKPHALSGTAVLEILSRHKTEPAVDGIVLMSESCILGPQAHSHVHCPDWTNDLVLFRRGGGLMCRSRAAMEVDGVECTGHAAVVGNCHIAGDDFSLSFEEI